MPFRGPLGRRSRLPRSRGFSVLKLDCADHGKLVTEKTCGTNELSEVALTRQNGMVSELPAVLSFQSTLTSYATSVPRFAEPQMVGDIHVCRRSQ